MAHIVMAYVVMAHLVMAYIVMAEAAWAQAAQQGEGAVVDVTGASGKDASAIDGSYRLEVRDGRPVYRKLAVPGWFLYVAESGAWSCSSSDAMQSATHGGYANSAVVRPGTLVHECRSWHVQTQQGKWKKQPLSVKLRGELLHAEDAARIERETEAAWAAAAKKHLGCEVHVEGPSTIRGRYQLEQPSVAGPAMFRKKGA